MQSGDGSDHINDCSDDTNMKVSMVMLVTTVRVVMTVTVVTTVKLP